MPSVDDRHRLSELIARFGAGALTPDDFIDPAAIAFDANPSWIDGMLAGRSIHDPDYNVFAHFSRAYGVILDVGANWGYSVGSIRASGSDAPIVSFEVSEQLRPCLERIKTLEQGRFDYILSGVGSTRAEVEFLTPTVNGQTISALTTGNRYALGEHTVDTILDYIDKYVRPAAHYSFKFCRAVRSVDTIDALLAQSALCLRPEPIAAIKIDVEGLEFEALEGAVGTLERFKPLLILEGGNRQERVRHFLEGRGYVTTARDGDRLRLSAGVSAGLNGIFANVARLAEYRGRNLLV